MKIFSSSRCGRWVGWMGRLVRLLCSILLPEGRGQEKVTKSLIFRKRWKKSLLFRKRWKKSLFFFQEKWKHKENLHLYLCAHVTCLHLLQIFQVEVLWQSCATRLWSLLWRWVRLLSTLSHLSIFSFAWGLSPSLGLQFISLCQVLVVTGMLSTARGRQRGLTKTVGRWQCKL